MGGLGSHGGGPMEAKTKQSGDMWHFIGSGTLGSEFRTDHGGRPMLPRWSEDEYQLEGKSGASICGNSSN